MKVYLNRVDGIADAITSMYFSKRSWNRKKEKSIRYLIQSNTCISDGFCHSYSSLDEQFKDDMRKLCKYGNKHTTMLRFIDFSITVEDLHRAGQDDWDAHAKRFENRIIRASTRLADFDYYKDKIIPTDEACKLFGLDLPQTINRDGVEYIKAVNGYIREDLKNNRDVKRGLYMESIPSSFIFKINLTEWAHVYRMRNSDSNANPEVKELAEEIQRQIESAVPWFTREFVLSIDN